MLKILKVPNIKIIEHFNYWCNDNVEDLKEISKYVDVFELEDYSKNQSKFSVVNYLDYINNLKKMKIPLSKKKLFPQNFEEEHDDIMKKVKVINDKELKEKIKCRYKELKSNIYNDEKYFIRPAESMEDMKDEAVQQNNCIYSNYSEKYANGNTDIYFLREIEKPNKSLVTVEVVDNKIRQKYQRRNEITNDEQNTFLAKWEEEVIRKVA